MRLTEIGSVAKIILERRKSRSTVSQAAIWNSEATNFACSCASLPPLPDLIKQLEGTLVGQVMEARAVSEEGGAEPNKQDEPAGAKKRRRLFLRQKG